MASIGETIRAARRRRGLSQDQLADAAGINRSYLSEAERGANISLDVLVRVAQALELREVTVGGRRRLTIAIEDGHPPMNLKRIEKHLRETHSAAAAALHAWESETAHVMKEDAPRRDDGSRSSKVNDDLADVLSAPGTPFRKPQKLVTDDWVDVVIEGRIAAGPPIDYEFRDIVRLPPDQAPRPGWKALEAYGDSMVEFGVDSGDVVYVEPRIGGVAATGEIVIGWLNEGLVIKQWRRRGGRRFLISGNQEIPPMDITEDQWELRAIVRAVVQRKPRSIEFPNISGATSTEKGERK